jgi:hypothetical protein
MEHIVIPSTFSTPEVEGGSSTSGSDLSETLPAMETLQSNAISQRIDNLEKSLAQFVEAIERHSISKPSPSPEAQMASSENQMDVEEIILPAGSHMPQAVTQKLS